MQTDSTLTESRLPGELNAGPRAAVAELPKGSRVLLIGYWGYRNLGDDLMLQATLDYLSRVRPDIHITVSVGSLEGLDIPPSVECIVGPKLPARMKRVLATWRSNAVIWIGGTCLYEQMGADHFSRLHRKIMWLSRFGKSVHFVNIGIGAFMTAKGEKQLQDILRICGSASFRTRDAFDCARRECKDWSKFTLGGDIVSTIDMPTRTVREGKIKDVGFSGTREYANDPMAINWISKSLRTFVDEGCKIHFLAFHGGGDGTSDHVLHEKIAAVLPPDSYVLEPRNRQEELIEKLAQMDFHIGMRLHSVFLADMIGVPGVGLSSSAKVIRFLHKVSADKRCVLMGTDFTFADATRIKESYQRPAEMFIKERAGALRGLDFLFQGASCDQAR